MSLPELFATLESSRDRTYADRKFAASIQGINLDDTSEGSAEEQGRKKLEELKAKVLTGGRASADDLKLRSVGIGLNAVTDDDGNEWWNM
jgi:soluble P-type ATPase